MVDVAQLVEPRIVIPAVVGSNPIVHPNPFSPAPALTSCAVGHTAELTSAAIFRGGQHGSYNGSVIVKSIVTRLLTLAPALVLTLIYGQATGDIGNAHAVLALLLGMGIGLQLGGRRRRAES